MMTCSLSVYVDPAIKATVSAAARSLAKAGLDEAIDEITTRVVESKRFTEVRSGPTRLSTRVGLTPFAELVLREVAAIGLDRRLDSATKAARISQTLNLAGF